MVEIPRQKMSWRDRKSNIRWKVISISLALILVSLVFSFFIANLPETAYKSLALNVLFLVLTSGITGILYEVFLRLEMLKIIQNILISTFTSDEYLATIERKKLKKYLSGILNYYFSLDFSKAVIAKLCNPTIEDSLILERSNFNQISEILDVFQENDKDIYKIRMHNQFDLENKSDESIKLHPDNIFYGTYVIDSKKYQRKSSDEESIPEMWLWVERNPYIKSVLQESSSPKRSKTQIDFDHLFIIQEFESLIFDEKTNKFIKKNEATMERNVSPSQISYEIKYDSAIPPHSKVRIKYTVTFYTALRKYSFILRRLTFGIKIAFLYSKLIENDKDIEEIYCYDFFWDKNCVSCKYHDNKTIIDVDGYAFPGDGFVIIW